MIHKPSDLSSVLSHINEETNEDTLNILNKRRKDNSDGLMFGNLNINSINTKFDQMKFLMQRKVDILVLTETKLDNSFPTNQFLIEGYLFVIEKIYTVKIWDLIALQKIIKVFLMKLNWENVNGFYSQHIILNHIVTNTFLIILAEV